MSELFYLKTTSGGHVKFRVFKRQVQLTKYDDQGIEIHRITRDLEDSRTMWKRLVAKGCTRFTMPKALQ